MGDQRGTAGELRGLTVAISCSSRELFGADRSALRLAGVLRRLGAWPTLVLPEARPECGLQAAAVAQGVATIERPIGLATSAGPEVDLRRQARAWTRHDRDRFDVEILNSTAVALTPIRAGRRITMVREWVDDGSRAHRALARWHAVRSDLAVAVSHGVRRQWHRASGGRGLPTLVIPNWLDDVRFQDAGQARPSGIVCLGRFNRWKGQGVLADAYEQAFGGLGAEAKPALTFVGAQPDGEFGVRSAELAARGERAGWQVVPFTADPARYLDEASLLVVPSLQPEPFGTVMLEGLVRGCRVLGFQGGGPDDLAADLPGIVQTVTRDDGVLAGAVRDWWASGGPGLEAGERRVVAQTLETKYSPDSAGASWERALAALLG